MVNVEFGHHEKHHLIPKGMTEVITVVAVQKRPKYLERLQWVLFSNTIQTIQTAASDINCMTQPFFCLSYTIFFKRGNKTFQKQTYMYF